METTQECCEQYCTSPGGVPQSSSSAAAFHQSRKLFKLDEPDMWDTAGEVEMKSLVTYSYGPPDMDVQKQDIQQGTT